MHAMMNICMCKHPSRMPAAGNDDMSDANRRTPVKGNKEPIGQCSCTALRKATRRVSQLYDAALEPCGLRTTQRAILNHIARAGAPPLGELAEALVMDRGALTHNLKPLERDGLVKIEIDPQDRRNRRVAL